MKARTEIVASGFGGQGVVRLGQILGEAAVKQGYRVTMLKSHGTEMRGGYVRSQIVMSKEAIDSPIVESPDVFVALSLSAYKTFKHQVTDGLIIYDPAFVTEIDDSLPCTQMSVSAKDISVENSASRFLRILFCLGFWHEFLMNWIPKWCLKVFCTSSRNFTKRISRHFK